MKVGKISLVLPTAALNVSRFRCALADDKSKERKHWVFSVMTGEWPPLFKDKIRFPSAVFQANYCCILLLDQLALQSTKFLWCEM